MIVLSASVLIFRSGLGPWGVMTCACGCGDSIVVWDDQAREAPGPARFYSRHHQPLGCDYARVCEPWDHEYDPALDFQRPKAAFDDEITPMEWPDALDKPNSLDDLLSDSLYDTKP